MAYTSCTGWSLSIAQTCAVTADVMRSGSPAVRTISAGLGNWLRDGKNISGRGGLSRPSWRVSATTPITTRRQGVRTAVDPRMEHLTERVLLWPQLARQAFVDDDFGRVRLLSFRPRKAAPRDQAHTDGRDVLVADIAGIRHRFLSALRHRLPFHAKRGHLDGLHGQTVRHRGRTRAGQLNISESKTLETTAYLKPNPSMTVSLDQFEPFSGNPYRPFGSLLPFVSMDYLHERQHKRELRLESAQKATGIAETQQLDLERTMLFTLRSAFVQTLQAKQLLLQAQANLDYYNKELAIFRSRLQSGGIARVDLDRMLLQRVQYESDYQGAVTNARTAKITLRMMLNEQTPVDQFDVTGPFEFKDQVLGLEEFHSIAEAARPDLKAAVQAIEKARTDHKLAIANGSTDPTFGVDFARNPPIPLYLRS